MSSMPGRLTPSSRRSPPDHSPHPRTGSLAPVATGFTLKITREGVVGKERFGTLDAALDALEQEARAFANTERRDSAAGIMRTYEPDEIVALRAEVAGRRVRAGVDVRGDGSAEAFTGRLRRTLISQEPGESPYGALRRVLGASA